MFKVNYFLKEVKILMFRNCLVFILLEFTDGGVIICRHKQKKVFKDHI